MLKNATISNLALIFKIYYMKISRKDMLQRVMDWIKPIDINKLVNFLTALLNFLTTLKK